MSRTVGHRPSSGCLYGKASFPSMESESQAEPRSHRTFDHSRSDSLFHHLTLWAFDSEADLIRAAYIIESESVTLDALEWSGDVQYNRML